ncbi:MAG: metallophosphoesterase [Halobacteria archaeon]|nr:metallophosphoesterase [Halobacteria archaeon]
MYLGIISDTHDNVDAVKEAVAVFDDEGVDAVIHCGDFISPPVIPYFDGYEFHGVLGNNDGEVEGLKKTIDSLGNDSKLHGRFADLEFDSKRFAVLHGEEKDEVYENARSGDYDYVLYGHHHVKERKEVGDATVINPGAHFPTVPEEHQTVVVLDTKGGIEFIQL